MPTKQSFFKISRFTREVKLLMYESTVTVASIFSQSSELLDYNSTRTSCPTWCLDLDFCQAAYYNRSDGTCHVKVNLINHDNVIYYLWSRRIKTTLKNYIYYYDPYSIYYNELF